MFMIIIILAMIFIVFSPMLLGIYAISQMLKIDFDDDCMTNEYYNPDADSIWWGDGHL
jgi:hypothetical protein